MDIVLMPKHFSHTCTVAPHAHPATTSLCERIDAGCEEWKNTAGPPNQQRGRSWVREAAGSPVGEDPNAGMGLYLGREGAHSGNLKGSEAGSDSYMTLMNSAEENILKCVSHP